MEEKVVRVEMIAEISIQVVEEDEEWTQESRGSESLDWNQDLIQ